MYTGSLPPTNTYSTWLENIELLSVDDDEPLDLSTVTEITLKLRDPMSRFDEMTLKMSQGDITIPSDGIIQWRAEATRMGALRAQNYEVIMLLQDSTDTVTLILGSISIVE